MMTKTSYSIPPKSLSVQTLLGTGNYTFAFSSKVTRIKLTLNGEKLNEGPPIKAFNASDRNRGTIEVEFEWSDKDVEVFVSDNCDGPLRTE